MKLLKPVLFYGFFSTICGNTCYVKAKLKASKLPWNVWYLMFFLRSWLFSATRRLCWWCFLFFFWRHQMFSFPFYYKKLVWKRNPIRYWRVEKQRAEISYWLLVPQKLNTCHWASIHRENFHKGSSSTLDGACAKDDAEYFTMIKFCNMLTVVLLWLWSVVKKHGAVLEFTGFSNTDFCLQQLLDCFINWLFRIL